MFSLRCESGRADAGRFLGPIIRRVWETTRARFAGRLVDDALDLRVASMFRSLAGERPLAARRVDGVSVGAASTASSHGYGPASRHRPAARKRTPFHALDRCAFHRYLLARYFLQRLDVRVAPPTGREVATMRLNGVLGGVPIPVDVS